MFTSLFSTLFFCQPIQSADLPNEVQHSLSIQLTNSMTTPLTDSAALSAINAQFIQNFITQNAKAHAEIIHPDFVCIESNGSLVSREVYLKNWATDYENSGCTAFSYADEHIRIFGNIALVRSKTTATILRNGQTITAQTIYTDTYLKENGQWKCIQVQITPVK
jgi:ketosteroid isomerase-like protein